VQTSHIGKLFDSLTKWYWNPSLHCSKRQHK